ncbi:dipeptidyl peptidase 4-like [Aplochiton taeniatus]
MVSPCKLFVGVAGAAVVIVLIVVPTVIFLKDGDSVESWRTFTLEDTFNSSLRPRSYNMRWISDHEYLHSTQGTVFLHNVKARNSSEFLSSKIFDQVAAYDYMLSADRKYVALMSNYSKAYVWENNVYVKVSPTAVAGQVTLNGKQNEILNGIPDWVYEEEMFSSSQGLWWSPGGRYVAYAVFNDTQVHTIKYSWYGEEQYPYTVVLPYPKPGTPNPVVKLFVVDAANTTRITEVVVPTSIGSGEHYLCTVTWVTDERVAVQWLKRTQNHLLLQIYDFEGSNWNAKDNLELHSNSGWIGRFSPSEPMFAGGGSSYYLLMSDTNEYKHIHHVVGGKATAVTSGAYEVISILKVTSEFIYYSSNQHMEKPGGRNVYRIRIGGPPTEPQCLTCLWNEDRCLYNSLYLSHNASYYRMDCSGPGLPYYSLWDNVAANEIQVLEENTVLEGLLTDIHMPTMRHGTIKLGEYNLWYQMALPPGFDESKSYPLLIDVYAGPCSQKVDFRYRLGWSAYLASTEKVIVASFDGRGSGYQGDKLMHSIYRRLGTYEVEDQITAAKEFTKMGFIDKERIAIWGWSYGGYVTSMVLGAGSGVFKCGMAVAPVSKWEYYDSIYTERYMNQPSENPDFYNNSTVTARAKNFKSVEYLLVHGTADDNVHFQQAAQISKALVDEQVDFDAMWYTDKDHGLDGSANQHVYTHMSHFLQKCFA